MHHRVLKRKQGSKVHCNDRSGNNGMMLLLRLEYRAIFKNGCGRDHGTEREVKGYEKIGSEQIAELHCKSAMKRAEGGWRLWIGMESHVGAMKARTQILVERVIRGSPSAWHRCAACVCRCHEGKDSISTQTLPRTSTPHKLRVL